MSIKSFCSYYFAKFVVAKNNVWKRSAVDSQKKQFFSLIKSSKNTLFGVDHSFSEISSYSDWKKNVPIRDYEGLSCYINQVIEGKENVLWPGKPLYFCKTSGTTSGVKYIPISIDSMKNHIVSARDAILTYIYETKNTSIVDGKMIFIQGSPRLSKTRGVLTGRLSGIVAHHTPWYLKKISCLAFKQIA